MMRLFLILIFAIVSLSIKAQDTTTLYYETGEVLGRGILEKGKVVGPWIFYFESGKKYSEGSYRENYMDGLWSYYYETGQLKMQDSSVKGIVLWQKNYYETGVLESFGPMVMLSNKSFWWSVGGGKRGKGKVRSYNALDIVKDGEWTYYTKEGKAILKEWFTRGKLLRRE